MAKRGRPSKLSTEDIVKINRKSEIDRRHYKKQVRALTLELGEVRRKYHQGRIDFSRAESLAEERTQERDEYQKLAEDRFIMGQTLAKQLVEAEKRITDLLAEIRMYEHETSTLRHIIIDGLRGYDR